MSWQVKPSSTDLPFHHQFYQPSWRVTPEMDQLQGRAKLCPHVFEKAVMTSRDCGKPRTSTTRSNKCDSTRVCAGNLSVLFSFQSNLFESKQDERNQTSAVSSSFLSAISGVMFSYRCNVCNVFRVMQIPRRTQSNRVEPGRQSYIKKCAQMKVAQTESIMFSGISPIALSPSRAEPDTQNQTAAVVFLSFWLYPMVSKACPLNYENELGN